MKDRTTITLTSPWKTDPTTAVAISARNDDLSDDPRVRLEFGEAQFMFELVITSRSARRLGTYLIAYADTADEEEGDPTVDAPPVTDDDAPEFWVDDEPVLT